MATGLKCALDNYQLRKDMYKLLLAFRPEPLLNLCVTHLAHEPQTGLKREKKKDKKTFNDTHALSGLLENCCGINGSNLSQE